MRVAVVQFAPKIGQVQDNIRTARKLCDRISPNTVDLVCLPEMIFSGYVFPDAAAITPYLEEPRTGPTSRFCAELAARLRAYIVAGYPERLPLQETRRITLPGGQTVDAIGANAAALYGPEGQFVGEYRKTNLYDTDMTWAAPGSGFVTFHLPPPLNTVSLGICMDLNVQPPAVWDSLSSGPYEIADYCIAQRTNLLVLLNAWLDSGEEPEEETDWRTLNYWASRLRPLWAKVAEEGDDAERGSNPLGEGPRDSRGHRPGEEVLVVVCNRCGTENGITFAGSSALFSLTHNSGRPRLLRAMTRKQEAAEVWTYPRNSAEGFRSG